MAIEIELYTAERKLLIPFANANGSINIKKTLQCIIDQKFIYELPTSPSVGGKVEDIVDFSKGNVNPKSLDSLRPLIKRMLSYYYALCLQKISIPIFNGKPIKIHTYSIGEKIDISPEYIAKIKGGPFILDQLIDLTDSCNRKWIVDFNASLNKEEWVYFCKKANFQNCKFIEQPCKLGILNSDLALLCPVDIYADEEMLQLTPEKIFSSPYSGFILKALRHNAYKLIEWIKFGQTYNFPFMISSMISDTIAQDFDLLINESATYNLYSDRSFKYFQSPLEIQYRTYKREIDGSISINKEAINKVQQSYELATTISIDFDLK